MSDGVGEFATAFDLVASETRLDIIRALGDASGEREDSSLPFSELQSRVGVEDNGRFNYHLQKLTGRFVEQVESGYRLRPPGISVYQAVIAGTYTVETTVDPAPIDGEDCPDCGATMEVWFEDARFHFGCRDCDELLVRYPIPPGSFDAEDPESLFEAGSTWVLRDYFTMRRGRCPYCAGGATGQLEPKDESMQEMGREQYDTVAAYACQRCHWSITMDVPVSVCIHPAMVSFFYDRGVNIYEEPPWAERCEVTETVQSTDPLTTAVTFTLDGESRRVVVDESLDILTVDDE